MRVTHERRRKQREHHERERERVQSPDHPLRIEYRANIHKKRTDNETDAKNDPDYLKNKKVKRDRRENDQTRGK
jgi:hypothetical protein